VAGVVIFPASWIGPAMLGLAVSPGSTTGEV